MDNPRRLALESLVKTDTSECFSNIEINTTLSRASLEKNDASLYTFLYLGVIEKKLFLDNVISQYSNVSLDMIDVEALNILRLGIYQLVFAEKIPDYSAVCESVNLAPKKVKGFVNAVLRSFLRNDKKISYPENEWERTSIEYSVPMEIINVLISSYGEDKARELVTYKNADNELSLRVNTLKANASDIISSLTARGYAPRYSSYTDDIIKCQAPTGEIKDILDTGIVFVQDEASRICTIAVDAKEGDTILDACACPGGKTFSMALDMNNKGSILACDLHKNKLSLISKGSKRLGIDIIEIKEQNGKTYNQDYLERFDKVLCDVPCSGLGVIFKKPEIKYKSIDNINNLPSVQYDILSNCKKYVKIGGYLVYSTCTINKEENENNIVRFLKENSGFEPVEFEIGSVKSKNGCFTFFPSTEGTDGFFVAKLKRTS